MNQELQENNIKRILVEDLKKYVAIILREDGDFIPDKRKEFLKTIENWDYIVTVRDSGTISMFANNKNIIMPRSAFKIFRYMKKIPGYGKNKKHEINCDGEIINDNTYFDYIKHAFIKGMDVQEFFRDTLLHETMHFCGACGGYAIREGLTELRTRELAQKYSLRASRCGYPKEVNIVNKLKELINDENIIKQITFADSMEEIYNILKETKGIRFADLFYEIAYIMDEEHKAKYDHSKFGGLFGPIKKAKAYSKINYEEVYKRIERFEKNYEFRGKLEIENPENISHIIETKPDIQRKSKEKNKLNNFFDLRDTLECGKKYNFNIFFILDNIFLFFK